MARELPSPPAGFLSVELSVPPGPAQAFDRWVVPELTVMLHVARTLTSSEQDAEDLVQKTLLRAYRAIGRFDGRHPRAWLLTILRNTSANRARRPPPQPTDQLPPEPDASDPRPPDPVQSALARLPAGQRTLVTLVYLDGLSYAEAALVLGLPVGTVRSRLHRATRRLRHDLRGHPEP